MRTEAVSMYDLAFKKVGHRDKVDVRSERTSIPLPWGQHSRPQVIEEDEWPRFETAPAWSGSHVAYPRSYFRVLECSG